MELLVVVGTFVIIVVTTVGLFVLMISHQRRILAEQELLSQASYATEYISRALRMAAKATDATCIEIGKNYETTESGQGIKFINSSNGNICQEFFLDSGSGRIKEIKSGGIAVPLTSESLIINKFNVAVYGDDILGDQTQPRVAIALDIESQGKDFVLKKQMQITVSQRNLDEE